MNKHRFMITFIFLSCLLLIVYNIVFFIIPYNSDNFFASRWISYIFSSIFILSPIPLSIVVFKNNELSKKVYGSPIILIAIVVIFSQILIDILFVVISNWIMIYPWVCVLIESIIFGVYIMCCVSLIYYRGFIEKNNKSTQSSTQVIYVARQQLRDLLEKDKIAELRNKLSMAYEEAYYSDPVSTEKVSILDAELLDKINELSKYVRMNNIPKCDSVLMEITDILKERKNTLK